MANTDLRPDETNEARMARLETVNQKPLRSNVERAPTELYMIRNARTGKFVRLTPCGYNESTVVYYPVAFSRAEAARVRQELEDRSGGHEFEVITVK